MRRYLLLTTLVLSVCIGTVFSHERAHSSSFFCAYDVLLGAHHLKLASWQIRMDFEPEGVVIVGIEGGALKGIKSIPRRHRRREKSSESIIITSSINKKYQINQGKVKVARLHLLANKRTPSPLRVTLVNASAPGGEQLFPEVSLVAFHKESFDD